MWFFEKNNTIDKLWQDLTRKKKRKEKWGQGKGYMEDLYTVLTGFLYVWNYTKISKKKTHQKILKWVNMYTDNTEYFKYWSREIIFFCWNEDRNQRSVRRNKSSGWRNRRAESLVIRQWCRSPLRSQCTAFRSWVPAHTARCLCHMEFSELHQGSMPVCHLSLMFLVLNT